jgi:hypothetical protein
MIGKITTIRLPRLVALFQKLYGRAVRSKKFRRGLGRSMAKIEIFSFAVFTWEHLTFWFVERRE